VEVGGVAVGEVGEVDPAVAADHGVTERVAWVRLDLDALLSIDRPIPRARPVSRFPTSDIDLAFVVDDAVPAHEIAADLRAGHELVRAVRLFDVFRGEQAGDGRRSLAFAVRLQAADRTLTDGEVAAARDALIERVVTHRPATLRG
jgi:phenylalanyl-tRNA synthetase beta chain